MRTLATGNGFDAVPARQAGAIKTFIRREGKYFSCVSNNSSFFHRVDKEKNTTECSASALKTGFYFETQPF